MSAYVGVWVDPPARSRSGKFEVRCQEHGLVSATVSRQAARSKCKRHRNTHGQRAAK